MTKPHDQPPPPDTIAFIEWRDSSGQPGPVGRMDLSGVHKMLTVGWLIRENGDHVTLCQDYVPSTDEFREVVHILKTNVVRRKEFKVKR